MSGAASTTHRSASTFPPKSGTSSSTVVPGASLRRARTTDAKCAAPPSGRSSRVTEVTTTCRQERTVAAFATREGSVGSGGAGTPAATPQKAHPRVQTSPSRITVAAPAPQHSPTFGHRASRHTVRRPNRASVPDTSSTRFPEGARTFSQSGRGARAGFTRTPAGDVRRRRRPPRGPPPSSGRSPSPGRSTSLPAPSGRTGGCAGTWKGRSSR